MWRKKTVSLLEGNTFLDVATGTGDVLLEIRRRFDSPRLVGVDLSLNMLKIAKGKVKNANFVCAPAERLPFEDSVFDSIVISFGLRNVVDKVSALFEFKRVLKSGGKLVILEFNRPVNRFFGSLYEFYSFTFMPFVGKLISKDKTAYTYLPKSIRRFPDVEFIKSMMESVGFADVYYQPLTFGVSFIHCGVKPKKKVVYG